MKSSVGGCVYVCVWGRGVLEGAGGGGRCVSLVLLSSALRCHSMWKQGAVRISFTMIMIMMVTVVQVVAVVVIFIGK